jgi:outer membrane protein OmpA-like peptidoglycan-associated protein
MSRAGLAGLICLALGAGDLILINVVLVPARAEPTADPHASRPPAAVDGSAPLSAGPAEIDAASTVRPTVTRAARRPDAAPPIPLPQDVPELPGGQPLIVLRFATNKVKLSPDAEQKVAALAQRLLREPALQVMVAGHSDRRGDQALNRRISLSRARQVTQRLVAGGIPYKRITTHGYGASRPAGAANLPGVWVRNRRVEVYAYRKEPR